MKKIYKLWENLPKYFKVIIIIIALLNLAVVSGFEAVKDFESKIKSNESSALIEEMEEYKVTDGFLTAEPRVIDMEDFEIGIMTEPDSSNNIVFTEENILINIAGNSQFLDYEYDSSIVVYLNQTVNDYLMTTFLVESMERIVIILLMISLIYLFSHLVFKISIKQMGVISNVSLMLAVLIIVYSIVYAFTQNDFLSFTLGSLLMGIIHLSKNKTKINQRVTKMYLGEGA